MLRQRILAHEDFVHPKPDRFPNGLIWQWAVSMGFDLPTVAEVKTYREFKKSNISPSDSKKMTNYVSRQDGIGGPAMHELPDSEFMLTPSAYRASVNKPSQGVFNLKPMKTTIDLNKITDVATTVISVLDKMGVENLNLNTPIDNGTLALTTVNGVTTFTVTYS